MRFPPMFPRGNGPLVSILIASRGRPAYLKRALLSCCNLAMDKSLFEFVVKLDDDDPQTILIARQLAEELEVPIHILVTSRGRGFLEMRGWVDLMCQHATGDWLVLLNDDAYLETQGWDQLLLDGCTYPPRFGYESICLWLWDDADDPNSFSFPCLRKKTFDILGHFSQVNACDLWIKRVLESVSIVTRIPIKVRHKRLEQEGGETRQGVIAASEQMTWEITCVKGLQDFAHDITTLANWLGESYSHLKWQPTPIGEGWQWYRAGENSPEHLVCLLGDQGICMGRTTDSQPNGFQVNQAIGQWAAVPAT